MSKTEFWHRIIFSHAFGGVAGATAQAFTMLIWQ